MNPFEAVSRLNMTSSKGFQWYSKYIADITSNEQYPGVNATEAKLFRYHHSVTGGTVLVVDSSISAVFLAALTLFATISIPLIFVRVARACAVVWNTLEKPVIESTPQQLEGKRPMLHEREASEDGDGIASSPVRGPVTTSCHTEKKPLNHLPILLSNSGQWLGDAFGAASLLTTHFEDYSRQLSLAYGLYFLLCLFALITGPFSAFLISRTVVYGFGDTVDGPCIGQTNFSYEGVVADTSGTDHHGRAMELLPFIGNFMYSWSQMGAKDYIAGGPVIDPISQVNYTRLDGCLLKDDVLCSTAFPHTHMVTAELTPAQMGMWSGDDWKFRMKGYCLRLNSSSISKLTPRYEGSNKNYYAYHLSFAPDSARVGPEIPGQGPLPDPNLGQMEGTLFPRRKNTIWDTYFPGDAAQESKYDRGWDDKIWRPSLHALNAEAINVETVFPTMDNVSQIIGDELYLNAQYNRSKYNFQPEDTAHILCWEQIFIITNDVESPENTTWRF